MLGALHCSHACSLHEHDAGCKLQAASCMMPVPSQITTLPAVEMPIGRLEYFDGVSTLRTADRFMRTSFSCAVAMS